MEEHTSKLGKVNRRIRGLLNSLLELGGDARKSVRGRLEDVAAVLDEKG